jgi:hypothetical protein
MPLLFYGRLNDGKRRLYSPDLRPIESSVFDNYMVKHLAPYEVRAYCSERRRASRTEKVNRTSRSGALTHHRLVTALEIGSRLPNRSFETSITPA